MSETLFTTEQKSNAAEFTVSEISNALKRTVEDAFGNVRVRGEISGYRGPHSSGHAYFSLKDDRARIEAVIWKMTFQRLKFRPEEGMEVIATGRLTTYPGSSKYQIVIDSLEPAGAGALMALLEERKRRLAAEGLFDAARKKPLPFLPRVIGVITSPTGAVIRDILHRVRDRLPLHVLVWPVRVQGDTVGAEVSNAVAGFNALPPDGPIPRPDLLIVARGGGSLEDLWGFNDEALARAVAASRIPVISAVGHETDTTLVDFVSDRRAPTPTGAAEIAVPVKAELEATLASLGARLRACMSRGVDRRRQALKGAARALPSPDQLLAMPRRRLDEATSRLGRALIADTEKKRGRLSAARLSPAILARRVAEARRRFEKDGEQLARCGRAYLRHRRADLDKAAARLRVEPIVRHAEAARTTLDRMAARADQAMELALERRLTRLGQASRLFDSLGYTSVLKRGYAVVKDADGAVVKTAAEVRPGAGLKLEFADGEAGAVATGTATPRKPAYRLRSKAPIPGQGSLF
ncbi:MAG: exodeoxyribonuclease VII large subunit [Rhizobiaceae bacterium]|nr:exodeoxyribonuclease VII large subunit [Rhizobiaceae bacterium]